MRNGNTKMRGEKGAEEMLVEKMNENFKNLMKNINLCIKDIQLTTSRTNVKRSISSHTIVKMLKIKAKLKIMKAARGKQFSLHKKTSVRVTADFPSETMQVRRE